MKLEHFNSKKHIPSSLGLRVEIIVAIARLYIPHKLLCTVMYRRIRSTLLCLWVGMVLYMFSKALRNKVSSFCSEALNQWITQYQVPIRVTQAATVSVLPDPVSGKAPPLPRQFLSAARSLLYIFTWGIKVIFQGKLSTVVSKDPLGKAHIALVSSCQNFLYR